MMSRLDLSVELVIKSAIMLFYAGCTFGLVAAISKHFFRTWHIPFYMNTPKMKKSAEETKTYSHLELLLRATSKTFHRNSVSRFLGLSAGVLVIVYVILLIGLNGGELTSWWNRRALGFAGLIAMMPYALLRLKLYNIRRENSYSLIDATELLLLKFRSPGAEGDLYQALYATADELQGTMKRAFSTLVTILQLQGKTAIREGVELFSYQISNSWSRQLGILFIKAAKENRDIGRALESVHGDMLESKRIVEAEKSENMDSIIMGYFPLFLVPASIFGINAMFEGAIFRVLFDDPKTLQALIICIIFVVVGLATSLILSKPKIEV